MRPLNDQFENYPGVIRVFSGISGDYHNFIIFLNMEEVRKWIKDKLNLNLAIDKQMQLFGIFNFKRNALNLILLLCRFYIYKTKMQKGRPSLPAFQKDFKMYFSLEKYIFTKNGNIQKFNTKWGNFSTLLPNVP